MTETMSQYPPRDDLQMVVGVDNPDVEQFDPLNPFDTVSRATPPGDQPYRINWAIPTDLPVGDYVLWVEVSKEFDQNASYDYPEPIGIPWQEYGIPYRGQPSVVWSMPFSLSEGESTAMTTDYVGYGDPDGLTGMLFEPDPSIDTEVPGSGAGRLLLIDDGTDMYRLRMVARPTFDETAPGAVDELAV